jgi:hypothetical protein
MSDDGFSVSCLGCGDRKRHYTTLADWIEHACRCGTTFTIDPETQSVGEVLSE